MARSHPDIQRARELFREARDLARVEGAVLDEATATHQLGQLSYVTAQPDEAAAAMRDALALIANLPQMRWPEKVTKSDCHYFLGLIALDSGNRTLARQEFEAALAIDRSLNDPERVTFSERALASCSEDTSAGNN